MGVASSIPGGHAFFLTDDGEFIRRAAQDRISDTKFFRDERGMGGECAQRSIFRFNMLKRRVLGAYVHNFQGLVVLFSVGFLMKTGS